VSVAHHRRKSMTHPAVRQGAILRPLRVGYTKLVQNHHSRWKEKGPLFLRALRLVEDVLSISNLPLSE